MGGGGLRQTWTFEVGVGLRVYWSVLAHDAVNAEVEDSNVIETRGRDENVRLRGYDNHDPPCL